MRNYWLKFFCMDLIGLIVKHSTPKIIKAQKKRKQTQQFLYMYLVYIYTTREFCKKN